jgi:hypothetical protein
LVALSGLAQPLAPGDPGTAAGTIDLAAIAAAADEHLSAATGTQKETAWVGVALVRLRTWTRPATSEYCPRIRALHGVGHGADARLGRFGSAPRLSSNPTGSYAVFL